MITEVGPAELDRWQRDPDREPPVVIDVREPWEFDYCRIRDSRSLPLGALPGALDDLPRNRAIVLVCHHGTRSFHAAAWLLHAGFPHVHNLRGGVAAWAAEVDPAMRRY